jgi:carboxylesterase
MGSLLSIYLAANHPEVAGVVLYAPPIKVKNRLIYLTPVAKHVIPIWSKSGNTNGHEPEKQLHFWSYDAYPVWAAHEVLRLMWRVRRLLPQVCCPALIFHAARDSYVRAESAQYVCDRIGSVDKELVTLPNSGHALTVDVEWEAVAERTYDFFCRVSEGG